MKHQQSTPFSTDIERASKPQDLLAGPLASHQPISRCILLRTVENCPEGDECFGTLFTAGRSSPGPRLQCDSGSGSGLPGRRRSRIHRCTQPQFELLSPIADSTQSCRRTLATSCSLLSLSTADISFIAAVSLTCLAVVLSRILVAVFQDSAGCGEGRQCNRAYSTSTKLRLIPPALFSSTLNTEPARTHCCLVNQLLSCPLAAPTCGTTH